MPGRLPVRALAVQPPDDGAENDLEDGVGAEVAAAVPGDGVDHVADADELVVELAEVLGGVGVAADLEELEADLVGEGVEAVEAGGGVADDLVRVVGGPAVGDDDDVDGADGVRVGHALEVATVRGEDVA